MKNQIVPYRPDLKDLARKLRKNSTLSEILIWKYIRKNQLGVEFHRQVPVIDYILDFYSHELKLAIEIDGSSHQGDLITKDEERQKILERMGIIFIRFTDLEVKTNISGVVEFLQLEIKRLKNLY